MTNSNKNAVGREFAKRAIVAFIILLFVVGCLIGIYYYQYNHIEYAAINYIKTNRKGAYTFNDMANDIGVQDINSFGFIVKGVKRLDIHYGKQVIEVTPKAFDDPAYNAALKEIGIVIKHHVMEDGTYKYRVEYCDEPIVEWAYIP